MKEIAVIGLGYVGLPLAIEFGKNRKVFGFDLDKIRIKELKKRIDVTKEIPESSFLEAENLLFTDDINSIKDCSIYIITVPTPIDEVNQPNLQPLKTACKMIGSILNKEDIVIFESTVFPGCTEEVCVPILSNVSNLEYNKDFYCGYSPERINPGDKTNTITKIKKITSGSNDDIANEIDELYMSIISAGTHKASSIKVAEAAKVIENTQRDLNIALINELSVLFEKLDIDTMEVLEAAESKWNFLPFKPGIVGGHCIGVDPYYLTHKAEQVGYIPQVILAGRRINDNMSRYIAKEHVRRLIKNNLISSNSVVGIFGVTFKENCPDIRNSKVFEIIEELKKWNIGIVAHDSWADSKEVLQNYDITLGAIDENNKVDSLIVAVGHNDYRAFSPEILRSFCKTETPVISDVKSLYNKKDLEKLGFDVFRL
ncbi:MAG: nucleotide sugar dehydrogenase [Gammaproteobacteria bacterium]